MLTGKQIKQVSKGHACIVIRFHGARGITLEGSTRSRNDKPETRTEIDDREESCFEGCYVGMFAMSYDSTWYFFQQSLKSTDEITFHVRQNGSQFTDEAGMIVEDIRARIKRPTKNGFRSFEMTLASCTMGADNPNRINRREYSLA